MPELPEVETVKKALLKEVKDKKILSVSIYWDNIIAYPSVKEFKEKIKNQTIKDIARRGKFLIFKLDDYYLLSHLRMEGKYIIRKKDDPIEKHQHVLFHLDNNTDLRYRDTRKFGKMYLLEKDKAFNQKPLSDLGLEPWDKNLTEEYLKQKGFISVTLGDLVLRTETVPLFVLSTIKYEYMEWFVWIYY